MTSGLISLPTIIPLRTEQSDRIPIDTNTLIEIRCETFDADIYYTLDGTKPDTFVTLTTQRSTIEYKKPFYVPRHLANSGRVTIKAIAVSRNGIRESPIATKMFHIKIVQSDHLTSDEYENKYLSQLQQERQELMKKYQQQQILESIQNSKENQPYFLPSNSQVPENYFQNRTDVLRCSHCFATKSNDLYTRFCTECGLPWQKLNSVPLEKSSIKTCANCSSTIPFNSDRCVVCETSVSSQYEQQQRSNSQKQQTTIVCPHCKSSNPMHLRKCYICESILMPTPTHSIRVPVNVPIKSDKMIACSRCSRLNNSDARFCNWCGAQPLTISTSIKCKKCQSNNNPHAKFCLNCGCVIEQSSTILDAQIRNDSNSPASSILINALTNQTGNSTINYYRQPTTITKCETATQTYGIYYPNPKDLETLIKQNNQLLMEQEIKEHHPVLTSVSPGKGYWRKQLDHICAHLKAFAANRPEFRSLIGMPAMGKMIHGSVHETEHQVTITTVFNKPENLSRTSFHFDQKDEHYARHRELNSTYSSTADSDDEYKREKSQRKQTKKRSKKRPESASTDNSSHALVKLLEKKAKIISKKHSHHNETLDEVKRIIKANEKSVNQRNKDGYTILQLAVRNGHTDCLETLIVDGKAKLNEKGPHGTTALHECCLLKDDGVEPLEILLRHGADKTLKNDRDETITDLASRSSSIGLMQVISKFHGDRMLNQSLRFSDDDRSRNKFTNGHRSSKFS